MIIVVDPKTSQIEADTHEMSVEIAEDDQLDD
jgi:hypothetical protein